MRLLLDSVKINNIELIIKIETEYLNFLLNKVKEERNIPDMDIKNPRL